jgi:hypothetical protein
MLIIYYPLKQILLLWLPGYADSLTYAALLFPICIYESKMNMLVNTYLKNLRKEAWLLIINLVSVFVSILVSLTSIFIFNNITLSILSIVLVLATRCIFAEILLSRKIQIKVFREIILELLLCILFMTTGWLVQSYKSTLFYTTGYLIYLLIKRADMKEVIHEVKLLAYKK